MSNLADAAPLPTGGPQPIGGFLVSEFLTSNWLFVFGGAWGLGFAFAVFSAIRCTATVVRAKRRGDEVPIELTEDAKGAGIAVGAMSMLGVFLVGVATIIA